jgi:hypothetical protein
MNMQKTIFFALFLFSSVVIAAHSASLTYVGVEKCKICHIKQYKVWGSSKHAIAFDSLKPDEQKQEKCFKMPHNWP